MKIFRKICVSLLLGVMATQAIGADKKLNDELYRYATKDPNLEGVKRLIKLGADGLNDALFGAVDYSNLEIVKYLISKGADVNAIKKRNGYTPLMIAAEGESLEMIKLLVSKGAVVNADVLYSARYRDIDILQYLISKGASVGATNQLISVIYDRRRDTKTKQELMTFDETIVKPLIKNNKANINECFDDNRENLLMNISAQLHRDDNMKQFLLDNGADINAKCKGKTALIKIIEWHNHRRLDEVKWLVSKGADVNIKDDNGKTALAKALELGYYDIAEFLIDNGAKKE
ncbi:ankyrin repeat domain-containing protein [Helicobacter sp. 23-1045]